MPDRPNSGPPHVFRPHARALVIAAHPDDPEFLFGATIAMLVSEGTVVKYVICSDGANGQRNLALTKEEVSEVRAEEQRAAAAALGVAGVTFLGFSDGRLEATLDLRREIAREIPPRAPGSGPDALSEACAGTAPRGIPSRPRGGWRRDACRDFSGCHERPGVSRHGERRADSAPRARGLDSRLRMSQSLRRRVRADGAKVPGHSVPPESARSPACRRGAAVGV